MMKPADLVKASLAGLAAGEVTCIPALEDVLVLDRLAETEHAIFRCATKTKTSARYRVIGEERISG
jgi:hypothetical protein